MSNLYSISWANIKGAILSGLIMAVLAVLAYVIGIGSIFTLNYKTMIDVGVISGLTAIVSLVKNFLTTSSGTVAGVQVVNK